MKLLNGVRSIALAWTVGAQSLAAQGATPPPAPAAVPVPKVDSLTLALRRAGWLSDRRAVRVGDLITIMVDEQAAASERISTQALNDRGQAGSLNNAMVPENLSSFGIGYKASSNNTGSSDRSGHFTAMLSVRVTAVEPGGIARIAGQKKVVIDGRVQSVALTGVVRADDIGSGNTVLSSRIAEAEISYQGKTINPKSGLFGKIIGALWP